MADSRRIESQAGREMIVSETGVETARERCRPHASIGLPQSMTDER